MGTIVRQRDLVDCVDQPGLAPAAWYCFNSGMITHPRGLRIPNAWGLHDTLGNAWEWTSSEHMGFGYGNGPLVDPGDLLGSSPTRIEKGGLAAASAPLANVTNKAQRNWDMRLPAAGLRLLRTLRSSSDAGPD